MRVGFRLWQQCLYRSSRGPSWLCIIFAFCLGYPYCSAQETIALVGSGSSVPAPLYAKWAEEYNKRSFQLRLRYLPLGTSEGIKQISHGSGDFGAGELPLTAKERADGNLIEVPTILIAIVPIYNLPGVEGELRLSGTVLADIFLGNVKSWDSPSIAKINPQLSLPAMPIKVVYRPGGKGSNYVFSYFLSKSTAQFRTKLGVSASPPWPVGSPAERSSDMVEKVRSEPGSIGYVEAQYAATVKTLYAAVLNPAGHFVKASEKTIAAACQAVEAPNWDKLSASLIDAPGADSYPIASFSWLYLRSSAADPRRAIALADLLNWMFTSGQQIATAEGYVALPAPLQDKVKDKVRSLR
jgi:phosphate transport system substrate-binding protein